MKNRMKSLILSKETRNYFFSVHFLAPALNWAIPISTIIDRNKDPKIISGKMTVALFFYSMASMRFALKVTPRNMLLFGCHFVNAGAQIAQGYRFLRYHYKLESFSNPRIIENPVVSTTKTTGI